LEGERLGCPSLGEALGLSVAGGVEPPTDDGLSDAFELEEAVRTSAGTAISNPMTKNTAAMMTLGNCIAFSRPVGPRQIRGCQCQIVSRSFNILPIPGSA